MSVFYCSYCGDSVPIISQHLLSKVIAKEKMRKKKKREIFALVKWHFQKGTELTCPGSGKSAVKK